MRRILCLLFLALLWPCAGFGEDLPPGLEANQGAVPRFYLVRDLVGAASEEELLTLLGGDAFAPRTQAALLEPDLEAARAFDPGNYPAAPAAGADAVSVVSYANNEIVLDVAATAPAMLVAVETFYPGWKADVDGVDAPVLKVNGLFRGIMVPAGRVRVRLYFRPWTFQAGLAVSLVTLAAVAVLLLRGMRRKRAAGSG